MIEERVFPLVFGLCLLLWLLAREPRIDPRLRYFMERAAFIGVAVAIGYALVRSLAYFLG